MTSTQMYLLSVCEYLSMIIVTRKFLKKTPIIGSIIELFPVLLFPIITEFILYGIDNFTTSIIHACFIIIFIKFIYDKNILQAIWLYIGCTIIIATAQLIALLPVLVLIGKIDFNFSTGIIVQAIVITISIIMYKFIPINIMYEFIQTKNRVFNTVLINSFVIIVANTFYWYYHISGVLENIFFVVGMTSILIFINIVTLKNGLKMKQQKEQLSIYESYMPIVDELINELRARQHEFDNHIQAISMISDTCTNYDEIKSSLKKYSGYALSDAEKKILLKFDNKLLAGFIYSKQKQAKDKEIELIIDIKDYSVNSKVEDYELVEIIGTLIDNAIDSCKENDNKRIHIIIDSKGDKAMFEVKNESPYLENKFIKRIFNKGYSTKNKETKNRGYGLYNLKNIIDRYNGDISVYNEKDINNKNWIVFQIIV